MNSGNDSLDPTSDLVRIAYLADYPESLARVAAWLHDQWWAAEGDAAERAPQRLRRRANRDRLPLALVALADGRPVGTASLVEDDAPDGTGRVPCLAGVFVVPKWRGRGVATTLCAQAVREAGRLAIPRLHLFTTDRERFFTRCGWDKTVDTLVWRGGEYVVAAWMELAVPPPEIGPSGSSGGSKREAAGRASEICK